MGIQDLQLFLASPNLEGGSVSVDLLKIAKNISQRQQPHNANRKIRPLGNKLKLIVDAENCLDRLYGGYFSDWACGGQWNRMVQFLSLLTRTIESGNIELAAVFNGTIEPCRLKEWISEQANTRQKVGMVLKHINTKGTPPPKVWWTAPTCLRSALRLALRHLGVTVMCTMDDHKQEVIAYCREYGFHGLLADDAEYAAFDPPRYFSSQSLKLTYKGSLETKEYMLNELHKALQVTQEQVCVMAALLGNFLLPANELQDLYKRINWTYPKEIPNHLRSPITMDPSMESNIRALADFVRPLPPPSNMETLVTAVFGSPTDKRASKFRQSVQYYLNGTASGFLKYCAPPESPQQNRSNEDKNKKNRNRMKSSQSDSANNGKSLANAAPKEKKSPEAPQNSDKGIEDLDSSAFASETSEQEQESLEKYKLATANVVISDDIVACQGLEKYNKDLSPESDVSKFNGIPNGSINQTNAESSTSGSSSRINLMVSSSSSNTSSVPSSPKNAGSSKNSTTSKVNFVKPQVSQDVFRTSSLRHQKGLMAPMILHVLSTQEVMLPCLMEDEGNREFPPIHEIYQPLRQHVYAVLFNLHHLRYVHSKKRELREIPEEDPQPDIIVKEWVYSRSNPYQKAVEVKAEPLPWAVPTLQRLWFGPSVDDKRRRMRALLSCLNSDTPLILNTAYVPQHMLILACVLRYIMSQDKPILRRHELDVFLVQAFSSHLMNPQYTQDLTLNVVTGRGVQLAAMFMEGVEMALVANDACGAPLPWLMCCPWLYFDGKLFNYTLNRSAHCKNILEVCENHIERVVKIERMRKAILENLDVKFAKIPLPSFHEPSLFPVSMVRPGLAPPPHCLPPMQLPSGRGSAALRQRSVPSRGGQLQIAGVVVGSWGANYGYQNPRSPHNMSGYQGRGRSITGNQYNNHHQMGSRGRSSQQQQRKPGAPAYPVNKKNNPTKKRNNTNKSNKNTNPRISGHTLTVKTESGDIPADEIVIKRDSAKSSSGGKSEDCAKSSSEQHKGQGDAPPRVEAATTN